MYDAKSRAGSRAVRIALALSAGAWATASAQLPGVPVLQNGFSNPGITVAGNFGVGKDISAFAGAAAWAPASGRFQVSGGLGAATPEVGSSMFAYGVRAAVSLGGIIGGDNFGIAPFAGIGGASEDSLSMQNIPLGVGVGYRRAIGTTRGVSVYATPFMLLASADQKTATGTVSSKANLFRTSLGVDFSFTPKLGVTAGVELGAKAEAADPGPRGSVFGFGVSFAFR